ncbi:transcriptional regulator, TraR/DksA family [Colwellia chukchiensis]|uniref:Transcriptional regulator, TraR/DksA family n=1 Tax=Colwellia chukchiensis TaxID=641665 RepID=A0A1H7LEJ5_9GAMM|nr:DksA/TraR family C4-type zinc finger protein [Colwellia chukchiensis]SEK97391.1 transcriptional regulator, TraR/DksA family [Colwellia chukchiensis]
MASGWAPEGAVQDQIDASIEDAVSLARSHLQSGTSAEFCEACDVAIPEARRKAIAGVKLCVGCQSEKETENIQTSAINRRGSKDSQLR